MQSDNSPTLSPGCAVMFLYYNDGRGSQLRFIIPFSVGWQRQVRGVLILIIIIYASHILKRASDDILEQIT